MVLLEGLGRPVTGSQTKSRSEAGGHRIHRSRSTHEPILYTPPSSTGEENSKDVGKGHDRIEHSDERVEENFKRGTFLVLAERFEKIF